MNLKRLILKAIILSITLMSAVKFSIACTESPQQLEIASVDGADESPSDEDYYVVQLPSNGDSITIKIKGSGDTPCPTENQKCKCNDQSQDPDEDDSDDSTLYTFDAPDQLQTSTDDDTLTWTLGSDVAPGEYKFKLIKMEQKYKDCPEGFTGGVKSTTNSQASTEVTILVYKITTQTVDTYNDNRARTVLGIGEDVNVTFEPSGVDITWNIEDDDGSGSDDSNVSRTNMPSKVQMNATIDSGSPGGNTMTYTAPDRAKTQKLSATIKGVDTSKIKFESKEPNTATAEFDSIISGDGTNGNIVIRIKINFKNDTAGDVSFANVYFREQSGGCSNRQGYYLNLFTAAELPHTVTANEMLIARQRLGNFVDDKVGIDTNRTPFSGGHVEWQIPFTFRTKGGTQPLTTLFTVTQIADMLDNQGNVRVAKLNVVRP